MPSVKTRKHNSREILNALKSVSDETRVRILHILSFASFNVNEITEVLGMGQSRISRHLKILTDAGLLESQREGSWVYYKISEDSADGIFARDLVKMILSYKEDLPDREIDQKKVAELLSAREQTNARFFNKIGKNWERIQEEVLNPKLYRKKIISFLPEKSNLILDLGCGPGALIGDLLTKSAKVTGIDSSPRMVEDAKNQFSKNSRVKILNSFLEDLPIANGAADSVVASMVLHHISNPLLIIEESNRVLKKGGVLCIVELKKHKEEYMRDKFADLWLGFDPEVLRNWMALSGFEIKNFEEIETSTAIKILAIKAVKKGGTYVRSN